MRRFQNWMLVLALLLSAAALTHSQSNVGGGNAVSQTIFCGTTVACAGTSQAGVKVVYGSAPLTTGTPSTATLTGLPFSGTTTYNCVGVEATTATTNLIKFVNASASSTVITGPISITDTISC